MKIKIFFILMIAFLSAGTFFYINIKYNNMPLSTLISSDISEIATQSLQFMEDVKFKDFVSAGKKSIPEHLQKYNVPMLIESLFQVKPELLDIQKTKVISTEKDSTGNRAKIQLETEVKLLNTNEFRKPIVMLYWKKQPDGKWYLDLASSIK
ncbi:MAG: hypothetical protein U0457_02125 [Candidatus Sericytochromatia bacterium]